MPSRNFHKWVGIDERVHDNENIYEQRPKFFLKGRVIVVDYQIDVLKKRQNYFETYQNMDLFISYPKYHVRVQTHLHGIWNEVP